jgi:hypothetical protein
MDKADNMQKNGEKNSDVIGDVQDSAAKAASKAKETAVQAEQKAISEAQSTLQSQKEMAAQELQGVAKALRSTSDQLRQQDQGMFARYGNQAADQIERASTYLEQHDLEELLDETEDFARRQPELFIGGAFTLGLLAARFLKSSASSGSSSGNYRRDHVVRSSTYDRAVNRNYPGEELPAQPGREPFPWS